MSKILIIAPCNLHISRKEISVLTLSGSDTESTALRITINDNLALIQHWFCSHCCCGFDLAIHGAFEMLNFQHVKETNLNLILM